MAFIVTTTGTPTTIILNDLGGRTLVHPTVSLDLELEYTSQELANSTDLQSALSGGGLTALDGNGNIITDPSEAQIPAHSELLGLTSDDHLQYHTDTRGDARYYTETELDAGQLDNRYYTETEVNSSLALKANLTDTRFPTSTEKSALVGTAGTPSVTNRYVTNDDARNTDSRNPLSHSQALNTISDVSITAANLNLLDDGANTTLHFHNTDRDRANHTGTQSVSTITGLDDVATSGNHNDLSNIGTNTHAQIDSHIASTANPHAVTKAQVGLGNVDNTSDVDKPISSATQTALNLKEAIANKNQNNGYAGLDGTGKINPSQLPPIAITDTFVIASQAAMLALTAQTGDIAVRTDLSMTFILKGTDPTVLADWEELQSPTSAINSVFGRLGTITAQADDYNASQITNTPAGNISSTNVQAAINELDSEKASTVHTHTATDITDFNEAAQDTINTAIAAGTQTAISIVYNDILNSFSFVNTDRGSVAVTAHEAALDPHTQYTTTVEAAAAAPVQSVFARTGAVISVAGDYSASQITNVASGNIAANTVQAAINELDVEKAPVVHTHVLSNITDLVRITKTANQTTTLATPVNDTVLLFPVAINTRYKFRFFLLMSSTTAGSGPRLTLTTPAGISVLSAKVECPNAADGATAEFVGYITASGDQVLNTAIPVINVFYPYIIEGVLITGATAGNLQLQFWSETAAVTTTMRDGSHGELWTI